MKIVDYADREILAMQLADTLAGEMKNSLLRHERVTLAVPGGTTPGPIFDALCAADLDWARVRVLATDERWVPEDHPRSNAALIRERLLTDRAAAATFLPYFRADVPPEASAEALSAEVAPDLPISVLLMGMGADMHVASLFAGAPGLAEALSRDAPPLVVTRPETQPEARITLSAPALVGAMSKHLVLTGADKRAALERALTLPPEEAPVQAVLRGTLVHYAE